LEEKLRTFIAVEIGQQPRQLLTSYLDGLRNHFSNGFRWAISTQYHLTIKFLGDTSTNKVEAIKDLLNSTCSNYSSFTLQLNKVGVFPNWRNPRTIWIGLEQSDTLYSLYKNIDSSLINVGVPTESRRFTPHLTLCRVKEYADPKLVCDLENQFQNNPIPYLPSWSVNEVVYFSSKLLPTGPEYSSISRHPLKPTLKV